MAPPACGTTNDIADKTIVHWHGLHVPADMDRHPRLVIPNGKSYVYEFEVRNRAGTCWYHPHPIHLHGKQFQVLERRGVLHDGYVDEGWKDTVLLMPVERIRLLVSFSEYPGLFLYHCHNLEYEDMGMMRNYLVENTAAFI